MLQLRYLVLIPAMVVLPTVLSTLAAQADTAVVAPVVASVGVGALLAANAFPIATILGAAFVWLLSHYWPAFNDVSKNADGTDSFVGTWAKRGTAFLATWLVLVVCYKFGATPPAQMVTEVGMFWTQFIQAVAGAVVSGGVFKMATTSPKKG